MPVLEDELLFDATFGPVLGSVWRHCIWDFARILVIIWRGLPIILKVVFFLGDNDGLINRLRLVLFFLKLARVLKAGLK